jgi:hypothetical protein
MMKLLKGEKTGLRIELLAISFVVLTAPLFNLFPQVPINGFCKFNSYKVEPGFEGIFATNFNNDSYTDLILYNSLKKKAAIYSGEQNGSFTRKKINNLPFEINNIQNITDKNNLPVRQIVVSRKSRKLAIARISSTGSINISNMTKLNSYPENVSYADVNNDGKQEVLISGGGYEGLSLFWEGSSGFSEQKIARQTSFSQSVFCDLNNDGFADIAAFNLLSKKLVFYYNDSRGDFRETRNIQFDKRITLLQSVNLNFDAYQDLAYAKGNSINILFGDSVSSYNSYLSIHTKYKPDKFVFGDFNKDGKMDIAYINVKDSILSIFYAKDKRQFYPEVLYFQKEGIVNLIPYYSKYIDGLTALSKNGYVYTLVKMTANFDDVKLSIGVKPGLLGCFDKNNNGIWDICYVDEFTKTLNLIVRNNSGIPSLFYSVKLYQLPNKIEIDNSGKRVKTFYCYTTDKKLIEQIRIDFYKNTIEHNNIYVPGDIKDLKIRREGDKPNANIYVAYQKNNALGFAQYEYKDFHYVISDNYGLVNSIYDAKIYLNKNNICYAWYWKNNKIVLAKISVGNKPIVEDIAAMSAKNIYGIASLPVDALNMENESLVAFFNQGGENSVIINSDKMTRLIKSDKVPVVLNSLTVKKYFVGEGRFNKLKKIFIYVPNQSSVYVLDFLKKGKSLIFTKLINAANIDDFFIKNMNGKDFHIIYTDGNEHNIRIKKI